MSQAVQPEQLLVLQSASCRLHAVRIGVYFAMTAQHAGHGCPLPETGPVQHTTGQHVTAQVADLATSQPMVAATFNMQCQLPFPRHMPRVSAWLQAQQQPPSSTPRSLHTK